MPKWTEARETHLRHLATTTGLSAGEIGSRIGYSRGAVIGKLKRMGLKLPNATGPKANRPGRRRKPTAKRVSVFRGKPAAVLHTSPLCESFAKRDTETFMAESMAFADALIDGKCCKFPVGGYSDPPGPQMKVCGRPVADPDSPFETDPSRNYCGYHVSIARRLV